MPKKSSSSSSRPASASNSGNSSTAISSSSAPSSQSATSRKQTVASQLHPSASSSSLTSTKQSSDSPSPSPSTSSSTKRPSSKQKSQHQNHQLFHQSVLYVFILLGLVYLAFFKGGLTDDPETAMIQTMPITIILQIWYCASGTLDGRNKRSSSSKVTESATSASDSSSETTKRRQHQQQSPFSSSSSSSFSKSNPVSSAIIATILSLIMSVLVFGLLILFGAPASTLLKGTFLCSVHISLLSVLPLVYVYNLDSAIWKDIISVKLPLNGVYGASVGTWVGAWLGAIPIPLDWDRPWQQWPVTILTGGYLGTALGTIIGAAYRKWYK